MSCSVRSCSFGKVQSKVQSRFSDKRSKKRGKKSKKAKKSKKVKKMSRKRSRRFGFKYLRNDQIIELVNHSPGANLTCDRA